MKKVKIFLLAGVAVLLVIGVNACKATKDTKDNITSAQDFSSAESEFAGAFDVSDDVNQSDGKIKKGSSTILPSGAILTWIDSTFTDGNGIEYILDFGTMGSSIPKGILCGDGRYRAGKMRIKLSQRYNVVGTSVNVIASESTNGTKYFSGDGVNMFDIEGTLTVTRTDTNVLTIGVVNGKISNDGKTATFQGNKTITRTKNAGGPGIWGDEYTVAGSGGGVNVEGDSYTWNITTPLLKRMELGCARTFVVGVIEIKNTTANKGLIIDFDVFKNAACDRTAKAIINGKDYIFTVK